MSFSLELLNFFFNFSASWRLGGEIILMSTHIIMSPARIVFNKSFTPNTRTQQRNRTVEIKQSLHIATLSICSA